MTDLLLFLAQTGPPAPPEKPSNFGPEFFLVIGIFLIAWIFFIQRPKKKAEEERAQKMETMMKKGARVVSIGGIHGKVVDVKEDKDTIVVEIAKDTRVEFNKNAINLAEEKPKEEKEKKAG